MKEVGEGYDGRLSNAGSKGGGPKEQKIRAAEKKERRYREVDDLASMKGVIFHSWIAEKGAKLAGKRRCGAVS